LSASRQSSPVIVIQSK